MLIFCDLWTKWSKIEQQTGLLLATLRYPNNLFINEITQFLFEIQINAVICEKCVELMANQLYSIQYPVQCLSRRKEGINGANRLCISHFEGEQAVRVVCHSQGNRVHSIGLLLGQGPLYQVDMKAERSSEGPKSTLISMTCGRSCHNYKILKENKTCVW